ncbi:MAG: DUF1501 domain-containing protein [Planctomycetaceae bacterium]
MTSTQHDNPTCSPTAEAIHTRRQFLARNAMGIGGIALATMLQQDKLLASESLAPLLKPEKFDMTPKQPHFAPRAQAMISLFMHGGPSHMDLTDPKPMLTKFHDTEYKEEVQFSFINQATKKLKGSSFKFKKHGESGMELSELIPHIAEMADDICLIRSMHTDINGHEPSIWSMNTGLAQPGRPALGSWLTYGLGSEAQDLPAYVVMTDPGGHPVDGVRNWSNGWMPPLYQGTVIRPQEPRIFNLNPPVHLQGEVQRQNMALLQKLNDRHLNNHPGEADLEARIASYELAARMQEAATEALDLSQETKATLDMYGIGQDATDEYGKRCLIARRLVERGVRFVQLFIAGQIWDNHANLDAALKGCCDKTDKPAAALIKDLKQRGLLDTTVVHWGGEIGRLPVTQNQGAPSNAGRDHNGQGFSTWVAGGGFKGGMTYGETDEFGHKAVVDKVSPTDYQATLLRLFGMDHEKLTFRYNGLEQTLTNKRPSRVVEEIIA